MHLTKFQYVLFKEIAQFEIVRPMELAKITNSSSSKISKNLLPLKQYKLIEKAGKKIVLTRNTFVSFFAQFLQNHPSIEKIIADKGFDLLVLLDKTRSVKSLAIETELSIYGIYKYLKLFINRGMIKKENKTYKINEEVWPDLKQLTTEAKTHSINLDKRIPLNSKVYFYSKKRIVFSTNIPVNTTSSSFSKYSDYGIPIFEEEKFYHLPKKKLSLEEVFLDSLESLTSIRRKILCTLFFLKHKKKLAKIKHPELDRMREVLKGKSFKDYPSLEEIKEKAEMYDIKIL